MKILSIDWDYFINVDIKTRLSQFPDGGNENLPYFIQNIIWGSKYISNEYTQSIEHVGVREKDYNLIIKILKNQLPNIPVDLGISHKGIYMFIEELLKNTSTITTLDIINIDFHHDLYGIGEGLNCGNWMNKVLEKKGEYKKLKNINYIWIKCEDSEENYKGKYKPKIMKLEEIKEFKFDGVYICRSDMWSPPHLDDYFTRLVRSIYKGDEYILLDELAGRFDEYFKENYIMSNSSLYGGEE